VSREALELTQKRQLFSAPDGRFYIKGTGQSACYVYADDAKFSFIQDRILLKVKMKTRMGTSVVGT
jgi:hypothetical protein